MLVPFSDNDSDTKLFNTILLVLLVEVELDGVTVVVELVFVEAVVAVIVVEADVAVIVVEEVIFIELVVSMAVEGLFNKFVMSFE